MREGSDEQRSRTHFDEHVPRSCLNGCVDVVGALPTTSGDPLSGDTKENPSPGSDSGGDVAHSAWMS